MSGTEAGEPTEANQAAGRLAKRRAWAQAASNTSSWMTQAVFNRREVVPRACRSGEKMFPVSMLLFFVECDLIRSFVHQLFG